MAAKFKIIYEDNMLLVADKPAGLLSQGDTSGSDNLLDILKKYLKEKYRKEGNVFLGLVHRLDRNTSGVICFARNSKAAARLSEQFRTNAVERIYHVVVSARPELKSGTLTDFLQKDEKSNVVTTGPAGKKATLSYTVMQPLNNAALLEVKISTGRPHQIRVQLAHAGLPVIGDQKYGKRSAHIKRPAVHAAALRIDHPVTRKRLQFDSPLPADIKGLVAHAGN
jgi:23S rRNA pseudouridine1911/1915/1917 synthase